MNKKIDIYLKNARGFYSYECSTVQSSNCKEAKKRFLIREPYENGSHFSLSNYAGLYTFPLRISIIIMINQTNIHHLKVSHES